MSDPDKEHSTVVGGSSAERILACNGSIRLVRESVPKSSSYADEGTALHMAMEYLLRNNEPPDAALDRVFFGHKITHEHVLTCLVPAMAAFDRIVGPREFELEVKAPLIDIEGAFGTTDVTYYNQKGRLEGIIDWKFGSGVKVFAKGNGQMMFYLYSQAVRAGANPLPRLKATIVQPRLGHVDTETFTRAELNKFVWSLSNALASPEVFRKGPWCHFCPGKPRCPEHWGKRVARLQRFMEKRN